MIHTLALTTYFGIPAVAYGGLLTLSLMLFTATIAFLNSKGIHTIPFKWHPILAIITIVVALIHGLFGMSIVAGF